MNEVDVDEAALRAQAAALDIPGEQPDGSADPSAGPEPEVIIDEARRAEEFARRAAPVVGKVLRGVTRMAVPNWQVTNQQHDELAQSVSYALALWFPHEIPPKWAALLMVGMSVYSIAEANRDPETGELRPRVKPRTRTSDGDSAAP